jgi:hypothetical protein
MTKEELIELTKKTKMKLYQQEKHYMQTIILNAIYSKIGKELVFKGGTALMFFYGIERFSEDLDFTLNGEIDINKIKKEIMLKLELLNFKPEIKDIKTKTGINFRISVQGPLYTSEISRCYVKIEISDRQDIKLKPILKEISPYYNEIPPFTVFIMNPVEITSEKIRAIIKRNYARDVYDLYYLIKKEYRPKKELVNIKMEYYNEKFDLKIFKKALQNKKEIWNSELDSILLNNIPSFIECKKTILTNLFGDEND